MKILLSHVTQDNSKIFLDIAKDEAYEIKQTKNEDDFKIELQTKEYDIIILDFQNLEIIKNEIMPAIIAMPTDDRPYIFEICQPNERKIAIASLGTLQGDYLLIPLDKYEVNTKLHFALQTRLVYSSKETKKDYSNAIYDPYTGIFNQHTIFEGLITELNRIKRNKGKLSIIIIEINELEHIQKLHGENEMFNTLRYISQIVKVNVRLTDKLGRWINNRFLLILPDCDTIHINGILERIAKSIYSLPLTFNNKKMHLTISAGSTTAFDSTTSPAFLLIEETAENFKIYTNQN